MFTPILVIGAIFWGLAEILPHVRADSYAGTTTIAAFGFLGIAWGFLFLWEEPGRVIANRIAAVALSLSALLHAVFLFENVNNAAQEMVNVTTHPHLPLLTLSGLIGLAALIPWLFSPFGPHKLIGVGYLACYVAIFCVDIFFPFESEIASLLRIGMALFLVEIGLQRALQSPHGLMVS